MSFFREKKEIKKSIEEYVASLKNVYGNEALFFGELCKDAEIGLIPCRYTCNAWAFRFENGPRGVVYDPDLPSFPLIYNITKKVGHHLLRHFERQPPIYIVEMEAHYFASAVINRPFISLRCIYAPPWYSLLVSEEKIKRSLANHYSLDTKPLLL